MKSCLIYASGDVNYGSILPVLFVPDVLADSRYLESMISLLEFASEVLADLDVDPF